MLASWEVKAWKEKGERPKCKEHFHRSRLEACQMTGHGDSGPYFRPIARWVGPKQIVIFSDRVWRMANSGGFTVLQLVSGTS